jgi:hypothetical protein
LRIKNPKSLLPYFACLAVVLMWFSPWWLCGKYLAPLDLQNTMMSPWREQNQTEFAKNHIVSDGVDQYLVYRLIAEKNYREEGWVGWSSLTYGGTAQYANTMALYYDWTMQLHRWFGFWTAWHLGLMGQILIAAYGMLLFLRGRGINLIWANCGALAYAANSQFVTWIYHRWALGAFCWVPWILWAIDCHKRGKKGWQTLVPVFIGMAFLGGTLQHAALVVLAIAAVWAEEAYQIGRHPGHQLRLLGKFAAWGLLGCGLAAMMFIPCVDALLTSNQLGIHTGLHGRSENGIYFEGWLQPLFNLASYPFFVFPSILGRCDSVDVLKLFKSDLFYVAYFGSLPVLIAFLSLRKKSTPLAARFLIGLGLLLPLTPLVRYLYQRLFLLFILGGIFAFTHYMQRASREAKLRLFKNLSLLTLVFVTGWTALSLALHFQPQLLKKLEEKIVMKGSDSSFGYFHDWIVARAGRFINDLSIWSPQQLIPLLAFALALAGLRLMASEHKNRIHKGALLLTLAVIFEVSLFGSRWIVWSDPVRHPLFPATAEVRALREFLGDHGRVTTLIHPTAHMARTPFIPNTLAPYGLATITGYDSVVPIGMILPNAYSDDASKLGRLGVTHLVTWAGNPDVPREWKHEWESPLMSLYSNTLSVPRYIGLRTDREMDDFLDGSNPEFLQIQERTGKENSRLLETPAGAKWVRIAENQAAGWEYRSEPHAEWLPVKRAADASMLIENPDPTRPQRIEMRYNPPLRSTGFWVSGLSLFAVSAVSAFRLRGANRQIPSVTVNEQPNTLES